MGRLSTTRISIESIRPQAGGYRMDESLDCSPDPNMLLLIDNYDSFTYNLAQYFGELGCELVVRRNDAISLEGNWRISAGAYLHFARAVHAARGGDQ